MDPHAEGAPLNPAPPPPGAAPALHRVFFVSRCRASTTELDVRQLFDSALRHNRERAITGVLMHTGGHFAQVMEGPAPAVLSTMAVIEADTRHEAVARLLQGRLQRRQFQRWTVHWQAAPGADDLLAAVLQEPVVPRARAHRLLRTLFGEPPGAGAPDQASFNGARNS